MKPKFKLGLRDQQRAVKASMEGMARLYGTTLPEGALSDVKDKVARKKPATLSAPKKSEGEVQSEIIDFLIRHPKVALVIRVNSGAVFTAGGGYVQFHHIYIPHKYRRAALSVREKMRAADLSVILTDGKYCAIEVKKEGWTKVLNEREQEQQNFLKHITECGGIGFFAQSVEDVRKALIVEGYV